MCIEHKEIKFSCKSTNFRLYWLNDRVDGFNKNEAENLLYCLSQMREHATPDSTHAFISNLIAGIMPILLSCIIPVLCHC
jgi:hypothetical protein